MESVFKLVLATAGASAVTATLAGVGKSLSALASIAATIGGSLSVFSKGFGMGAELEHLHLRTGQSVRDLALLQSAFKRSGIESDKLAPSIARLHKAIDTALTSDNKKRAGDLAAGFQGLEEEGYAAGDAFQRMGVTAESLRRLPARAQFEMLASAFAKLPTPVERSAIAMKLFGKSGAELVQLFAKENVFEQPEASVRLANRLEGNAAQFEKINRELGIMSSRFKEMWVVAAEKLAPSLESVNALMKGINLTGIGAGIGAGASLALPALAIAAFRPLDNFMLGMATSPALAGTLRQSVAGALAPMTGALAKILPIGLAAAIIAEVSVGIYAAYREAENAKTDKAGRGVDTLNELTDAAGAVRSDGDAAAVLAKIAVQHERIAAALKVERDRMLWTDATKQAMLSYEGQLTRLSSLNRILSSDWRAARIEANQAADAAARHAAAEAESRNWLQGSEAARMRKSLADDTVAMRSPEERLPNMRAYVGLLDNAIALLKKGTAENKLGAIETEALLKAESQRADTLRTIAELESKIAQKKIEQAKIATEQRQLDLADKRAALEGNFGKTEREKWGERKQLLSEEIIAQQEYLDHLMKLRATAADAAARATYDTAARGAARELSGLKGQQANLGPNPGSLHDQTLAKFTQVQDSLRSVQENIAGTFSGAITASINQARQGMQYLLGDTDYWSAKLGNIAGPIMGAVTAGIANMFVEWVAGRALAFIKGLLFGKAEAVASIAIAAGTATAMSAIWAVPATLATIATLGAAAAGAPPAILGAQGIVLATSLAGFSEGGYTGEAGGIVHPREYVFSAPAVSAIGVDNLERAHRNAVLPTAPAGDAVGGGGGGSGGTTIAFFPSREEGARYLKSRSGRKVLMEHSSTSRRSIGLPT